MAPGVRLPEAVSPYPQMKVAVSRVGDHNSDDDSVLEASSSRQSSPQDQLSDVSALAPPWFPVTALGWLQASGFALETCLTH